MRQAFPELSVTNEDIQAAQRAARKKLANQPEFKNLVKQTAQAVKAERDYVTSSNQLLQRLHKQLFGN